METKLHDDLEFMDLSRFVGKKIALVSSTRVEAALRVRYSKFFYLG